MGVTCALLPIDLTPQVLCSVTLDHYENVTYSIQRVKEFKTTSLCLHSILYGTSFCLYLSYCAPCGPRLIMSGPNAAPTPQRPQSTPDGALSEEEELHRLHRLFGDVSLMGARWQGAPKLPRAVCVGLIQIHM